MSAPKSEPWRAGLKLFRERMGGVTERKKAMAKHQTEALKSIRAALKDGPKTIPAILPQCNLPGPELVWFLMAMKRYGMVVETGHQGDYLLYRLKEDRQ
jgi:hypothetical protein